MNNIKKTAASGKAFDVRCSVFDVRRSTQASAFTLLEVLLAITITGFVLAAASTMIVSVTNIWSNRQDSYFFEDHVHGVAEFVQSCFSNAGAEIALSNQDPESGTEPGNSERPPEGDISTPEVSVSIGDGRGNRRTSGRSTSGRDSGAGGSSLLRRSEEPIGWAEPPGFAGYRDPLLNFKLKEHPPLLVNTDNAPVQGIDAFFYFEESEGLSLLWYSLLQEEVEDENDLRRTQISPYVTAVRYVYWDERFERWEEEDEPKEGEENDQFLLPRYLKLTFEREGIVAERTIAIPVPSRSALLF